MKKINFKAEAHKALTRILSIESKEERERTLAAYFQDMHDLGARAKPTLAIGREENMNPLAAEVTRALGGLKELKTFTSALHRELRGV